MRCFGKSALLTDDRWSEYLSNHGTRTSVIKGCAMRISRINRLENAISTRAPPCSYGIAVIQSAVLTYTTRPRGASVKFNARCGQQDFRSIPKWLAIVTVSICPIKAFAQVTPSVFATGQYQYNSNIFDLQRGFQSNLNDYGLADRFYAYGAGVNFDDKVSRQDLFFKGSATQYDYDHFSQLTHNEYTLEAGWLWSIGSNFTGSLEATRTRSMVPFTAIVSVSLSIETVQHEQGSAGFLITPEWRFDANGYTENSKQPVISQYVYEPNVVFNDSGAGGTLKYLGAGEWVGNVNVNYQHGSFSGVSSGVAGFEAGYYGSAYGQWTETVGATYAPSGQGAGKSTFDFGAGHTSRTSHDSSQDFSGLTGHLDYARSLTGKTSVSLALDRNISTFITDAGSDITSSAALSATWQATYKTGVNLGYNIVYVLLPSLGPGGTDRGDHLQFATFALQYKALDWLAIQPYANYQTRRSNLYGANFNASIFGATIVIQWPKISGAVQQPAMNMAASY